MDSKRELLKNVFRESLDKMDPEKLVTEQLGSDASALTVAGTEVQLNEDSGIHLIAVGKAAAPMAEGAVQVLGKRIRGGIVIAPHEIDRPVHPFIELLRGSHPVPDDYSLNAARRAVAYLEKAPAGDFVLFLISGGTSSLLTLPGEGISIEDLNETYELLNNSGAKIGEINTVRKHLSRVKGGQLLNRLAKGVKSADLIISDVPGDDPAIIGSGPTTPDSSTFEEAQEILERFELWNKVPDSIRAYIEQGLAGQQEETPSEKESGFREHSTHIIGSARLLAEQAAEVLEQRGYTVQLADEVYNMDVAEIAGQIANEAIAVSSRENASGPQALLYYGESTVKVTGSGKGGRNQELALRGALHIAGHAGISWLSAGSDGIDGPTDAAGAIVSGSTVEQARDNGIDPEQFLQQNDSYHFHKQAGTLLITGPTGNNVMDLQIVLINR